MNFHASNQATKVTRVLGYDYSILFNTPLKDLVIRLATPTDMQRMDGVMPASPVKTRRKLWRQALVDEQLHAASTQGRPPGRPISGCARA